nr:hypothetical protein [Tanacetum cinerariifolium]
IYKPTNNNLRTSSNTSRANQDNSPRIYRNAGYEGQRSGTIAGARDTVGSSMVQKSGIQCYNCKEYGQVSPDVDDSGPIFDKEPEQKIEQNDEDVDLAKEHFKNKNKSLTEANNKLSEVNAYLYADYKKLKDELKRRNTVEYATEMELECAKLRGELLSNKMEHKRYSEKDTHVINGLKQTVSELQKRLSAHQDTISVLKQQKDAQIKLYKTREDKDIEKVIDLENKVKVLDNIVYKTGQSVQTINMLNNKCRTSFVNPEYLKKAKQANPCLYDIGCYNDNLALMLSPDSDEVIRLEKESR